MAGRLQTASIRAIKSSLTPFQLLTILAGLCFHGGCTQTQESRTGSPGLVARVEYYPASHNLQSYCQHLGEARHGYFQSWYVSGTPEYVGSFDHGVRNGLWIHFYPTGAMAEYGVVSRADSVEGHLKIRSTGYEGVLRRHGLWRQFWPDGQVKARGYYDCGARHGRWREFTRMGVLYSISEYEEGRLVSCRVVDREK
jgi:antitoxin component YwqK of YwqJK toxin-antitoxin module